ncbi:hypothetical protein BBD42_29785 [Paenibacillus sp. BIHB 4019]|uniref:HTH tetR-type domain-containing protein n=2 Tax=Paenibacillus sp. BIHB 4019 TaxID=1870819 RepID=A0A1B2DTN6_9BACL|nr:hypothetical protein BBD42_29785 [Paenibacillus sp. BIHB 4019]
MTLNRIKQAALTQFAVNGYEGASLAHIANEVGIKKQSIYTHFSGKDELFLEVFKDSFGKELQFVNQYFGSKQQDPFKEVLHNFLLQYLDRYEQDSNTNFFLRTVFFAPLHLKSEVVEQGNSFIDQLEEMLIPLFNAANLENNMRLSVDEDTAAIAFIAVLDGLFMEMLFGNAERTMRRLNASWSVYWSGIQQGSEGT